MQLPSFFQKFGRDIVYLCVIAGMAGWIWVDGERQEDWNNLISRDLSLASITLQRSNTMCYMGEFDRLASEYPSPQNEDYKNRARGAQKKVMSMLTNTVGELRSNILSAKFDNVEYATRTLTKTEIQNLSTSAKALADTLFELADHEIAVSDIIKNTLTGDKDRYWEIAQKINLERTPVFSQDILLRVEVALASVLAYCQTKITPGIICDWGIVPSIAAKSTVIRPGETYNADIFWAEYSTRAGTFICRVNGETLPIKDGIAYFSKRYTTPGIKKNKVEFEIKNKFSGITNTYSKEYTLIVVDSCR